MEVDDLTEEQRNALSRFREFTHIDSVETCRQYLTVHEWDVERAVNTALISSSDFPSSQDEDNRITTDDVRPSAPPMPESFFDEPAIEQPSSPVQRDTQNPIMRILRIPLSFLYAFYLIIEPFIPRTAFRFVLSFVQSLWSSVRPVDPIAEIDAYCAYFDNLYGTNHPVFYRGRLAQALADVRREARLLFIYLHDKNSPSCERFCREVLCEDALRLTIGDNLLWSASTDTQEGMIASRLLHANAFPCFCIAVYQRSQLTVQLKLDGYRDADEFLAEIINGVQHADEAVQFNRELRNSRSSRDRLLEEQNAAYLESVRADQEKAQQRLREENERRQLEEDQRRLQEEKERKLQESSERRENIRKSFPEEPISTETDIIQVSIRLPENEPIRRRFRRSDSARLLFEFAWTNPNVPDQFELLWGYPRKRYHYEQVTDKSIGDVMNGNTETCFLEQIDEDYNS